MKFKNTKNPWTDGGERKKIKNLKIVYICFSISSSNL
jgi:hypothetical protein